MSLQGPNTNVLAFYNKLTAFIKKLKRCVMRVEEGGVEMFPELEDFMDSYDIIIQIIKGVIAAHLRSLLDSFPRYFPRDEMIMTPLKSVSVSECCPC